MKYDWYCASNGTPPGCGVIECDSDGSQLLLIKFFSVRDYGTIDAAEDAAIQFLQDLRCR